MSHGQVDLTTFTVIPGSIAFLVPAEIRGLSQEDLNDLTNVGNPSNPKYNNIGVWPVVGEFPDLADWEQYTDEPISLVANKADKTISATFGKEPRPLAEYKELLEERDLRLRVAKLEQSEKADRSKTAPIRDASDGESAFAEFGKLTR